MAATRASTGNSKPRVQNAVSTTPERQRKTATSRATKPKSITKTAGTKKSATGAGVKKARAPNAHHKRKPHLKDKIEGALDKAEGTITRKPGKKAAGTKKMRGTDGKNSRTTK